MKVTKSSFYISVANSAKAVNDEKNQIAFVGRSNVGKSSLINMLVNNSKLCKTSSTPGRTRLINYFLINDSFYFVDLPGYGYAQASKKDVYGWQGLIEPYLLNNDRLKCVCALVDVRHDPTEQDKQMINYLHYYQIPFIIVATKCDKLPKSKVKPTLSKLANSLNVGAGNVYGVSSETKYGKEELLSKLDQFLN
ncbi:MAG: YihA family ribosome biogenesis GTP-binding protein [Clostridia bacterium]|nr:YihA family ribosome biogenesis GTP-binding protein [Clostridia bacterium]MBR4003027.1 YihA family ribosome biogenesis GTP-binding protein [Clostridia bacterium]